MSDKMTDPEMALLRAWHASAAPGQSVVLSWATLGRLLPHAAPLAPRRPAHRLDREAAQLAPDGDEA